MTGVLLFDRSAFGIALHPAFPLPNDSPMKPLFLIPITALQFSIAHIAAAQTVTDSYTAPNGTVIEAFNGTDGKYSMRIGTRNIDMGWNRLSFMPHNDAEIEAAYPNRVLVHTWGGGTSCGGMFHWVNVDGTAPAVTKEFGRCSEWPSNLRMQQGVAVFENAGYGSEGTVSFLYDGVRIHERNAGLAKIDGVENPFDPMAWVDQHPGNYMMAPDNETFLTNLLGWETLSHLRQYTIGSTFHDDVEYVVGDTCAPGVCNKMRLVIAIAKSDGMPFIAFQDKPDADWTLVGDVPRNLPNSVRGLMTGTR